MLATEYAKHFGFTPQLPSESNGDFTQRIYCLLLFYDNPLSALEVKMNTTYTGIDPKVIEEYMAKHGYAHKDGQ